MSLARKARNPVMHVRMASAVLALLGLSGCFGGTDDRPVVIDVIGRPDELANPLRHAATLAGQTTLGATAQGLVAFDAQGDVVAGLAESWIVADEGQSYIFRLRQARWQNGETVRADVVASLLQQRMRANRDLLAGLRPEVRAMTDRVIEIRLTTALPAFLQLLAQPSLGIIGKDGGTGPYVGDMRMQLLYLRPQPEGDGRDEEAPPEIRPMERRTLQAGRAALGLARFQADQSDMMLGGRFEDLLLIPHARLGTTDVRADPVPGLFGLAVVGTGPFLADRDVRDALARTIDRGQLARALNLQGWTGSATPLPAQLDLSRPPTVPVWSDSSMPQRRGAAQAAIDRWRARNGDLPLLKVALPTGAGASLLFSRLSADLAPLGLRLDRVKLDQPADLRLIDAVAPFDSALWYLSRLDCDSGISCDPDASTFLDGARNATSIVEQATMLGEAERRIVNHAGFIPLGVPIRWSLVSRRLTGFAPSPRGVHPLNRLIAAPN